MHAYSSKIEDPNDRQQYDTTKVQLSEPMTVFGVSNKSMDDKLLTGAEMTTLPRPITARVTAH